MNINETRLVIVQSAETSHTCATKSNVINGRSWVDKNGFKKNSQKVTTRLNSFWNKSNEVYVPRRGSDQENLNNYFILRFSKDFEIFLSFSEVMISNFPAGCFFESLKRDFRCHRLNELSSLSNISAITPLKLI